MIGKVIQFDNGGEIVQARIKKLIHVSRQNPIEKIYAVSEDGVYEYYLSPKEGFIQFVGDEFEKTSHCLLCNKKLYYSSNGRKKYCSGGCRREFYRKTGREGQHRKKTELKKIKG